MWELSLNLQDLQDKLLEEDVKLISFVCMWWWCRNPKAKFVYEYKSVKDIKASDRIYRK